MSIVTCGDRADFPHTGAKRFSRLRGQCLSFRRDRREPRWRQALTEMPLQVMENGAQRVRSCGRTRNRDRARRHSLTESFEDRKARVGVIGIPPVRASGGNRWQKSPRHEHLARV
jgi:hypothetical protein